MFRAELLIFGEVKNDSSEEVKSAAKSVSEIGSVRHQIRSKSFKAYRFQRSVRLDCFDRAMKSSASCLSCFRKPMPTPGPKRPPEILGP